MKCFHCRLRIVRNCSSRYSNHTTRIDTHKFPHTIDGDECFPQIKTYSAPLMHYILAGIIADNACCTAPFLLNDGDDFFFVAKFPQ